MKKTILIGLCMFLLAVSFVQGAELEGSNYWHFNDNVLDQWDSMDGTLNGNPTYVGTPEYPSYNISGDGATKSLSFDGNDWVNVGDLNSIIREDADWTVSMWIRTPSTTDYNSLFGWQNGNHRMRFLKFPSNHGSYPNWIYVEIYDGVSVMDVYIPNDVGEDDWHHLVVRYIENGTSDSCKGFVDYVTSASDTENMGEINAGSDTYIGDISVAGDTMWVGEIDEVKVYNFSLNDTAIQEIFNKGYVNSGGGPPPPPPTEYLDITATDNETSAPISIFNATIDLNNGTTGLFFSTTNGTITTGINQSLNLFANITLKSNNYYPTNYSDYNISSNLAGKLNPYHYFHIFTRDNETSAPISIFNATVGGDFYSTTNGTINTNFLTTSGNKAITLNSYNYHSKYFASQDISSDLNTTLHHTFARVYIEGFIAPANVTQINNFTGIATSFNSSHQFSGSTTDGNVTLLLNRDEFYNVTFDAEGYAYVYESIFANPFYLFNFSAYTTNSINLNVFDYSTLNLLTQNTSFYFISNNYVGTHSTTNGTLYVDILPADFYELQVDSENYSTSKYYFTITDRSHQTLDTYLIGNTTCHNVQFTTKNQMAELLSGVILSFNKLINLAWIPITQIQTDISGTGTVCLDNNKYLIYGEKSGYDTWDGELIPVGDEYTIIIDSEGSTIFTVLFSDVSISYYPIETVLSSNKTNFTFAVSSDSGIIDFFGLNSTYGNTTYITNVTNSATGGMAIIEIPLNESVSNKATITFFLQTIEGESYSLTINYLVLDYAQSAYGLKRIINEWVIAEGEFEIAIFSYIFIIILVVMTAFAGARDQVLMGVALLGTLICLYFGALNAWIGGSTLVLLVGLFIAMGKRGGI